MQHSGTGTLVRALAGAVAVVLVVAGPVAAAQPRAAAGRSSVHLLESDAYEPDDTYENANTVMPNGGIQEHTLFPAGDQDWVTFDAIAGFIYEIETTSLDSTATDTVLSLYAADGITLLAENDDWNGKLSLIAWEPSSDQKVYVKVRHFAAEGTGPYGLRVVPNDATPPTTAISVLPSSPDGQNGWYTSPASIILTPNEPATTWYWWDGDAPAECKGGLIAPEGSHTLHYYSADVAGNEEDLRQRVFKVDTVKPGTPSGLKVTALSTTSLRLTWTAATDATSGIWQYAVYNTASGTVVGTTPATSLDLTGLAPGSSYSYYVVARDNAGLYGDASGVASGTTLAQPPPADVFVGIAGANRYATAVEVSKKAFPDGAEVVVIATGENWPDALGGSALAGAAGGPILLTRKDTLPPEVVAELDRLKAKRAYVLGSTASVSAGVESALKARYGAGSVYRLGGPNRYATSRIIASVTTNLLKFYGAWSNYAFVATGTNFPDALAASPLAAANGWPIYLAEPDSGSVYSLVDALKAGDVTHAIVLGDARAVPTAVESALAKGVPAQTLRLAGSNRYETAVAVAAVGLKEGDLAWDKLALATGTNFPDALAGGVLQGKDGSVLLLTPGSVLNPSVASTLTANRATIHEVRFLGDTKAISNTVRAAVENALK